MLFSFFCFFVHSSDLSHINFGQNNLTPLRYRNISCKVQTQFAIFFNSQLVMRYSMLQIIRAEVMQCSRVNNPLKPDAPANHFSSFFISRLDSGRREGTQVQKVCRRRLILFPEPKFVNPSSQEQFHDGIGSHKESIQWNRCLGSLKVL